MNDGFVATAVQRTSLSTSRPSPRLAWSGPRHERGFGPQGAEVNALRGTAHCSATRGGAGGCGAFRRLRRMAKLAVGGGIAGLCALMVLSTLTAGRDVVLGSPAAVSTVPAVDVAASAEDPAVRMGPVTTTSSTVPRTIGACVAVGLETPNSWRAALGLDMYLWSDRLYDGACAWATDLARQGGMTLYHEPGPYGETLYLSRGCSGMWNAWYYSPGHYAAWASKTYPEGVVTYAAAVTVTDSDGICWGVGRVDVGGSS